MHRTISEIKESEQRARVQADLLKATLAENSLELRVKAASDAEATYNQRHSVAEAEIPELRARLDAAKRFDSCHGPAKSCLLLFTNNSSEI